MTPPTPSSSSYTLPSTFTYSDWNIKYALLSPTRPSLPTTNNDRANRKTKTLLFIHGTPWSSAVFQPLAQSLLATWFSPNDNENDQWSEWQILLYDLPGYGQSQSQSKATSSKQTAATSSTSIKHQASALHALLLHLNLIPSDNSENRNELHILAHDIAGSIALRAHLLHSLPITSLLLLDTNCVLPWGDGFYKLARQSPDVFREMPGHVHEAVVRAVVRSGSAVGLEGEWEDVLAQPWLGREGQEAFVRQIAEADDRDVGEMCGLEGGASGTSLVSERSGGSGGKCLYPSVQFPVRILWGSEDTWIPREKMELLRELLDRGEKKVVEKFVVIQGAGHLLMLDEPEVVEKEVREWLGM